MLLFNWVRVAGTKSLLPAMGEEILCHCGQKCHYDGVLISTAANPHMHSYYTGMITQEASLPQIYIFSSSLLSLFNSLHQLLCYQTKVGADARVKWKYRVLGRRNCSRTGLVLLHAL